MNKFRRFVGTAYMPSALPPHILAYGFYLLLAILVTYPLITQMNSAFVGAPESDAYEYARHIWWYTFAPTHGEPLFHHTYLAHPDGLPALWLWAIPLQSFPAAIFSWVIPLPVAYNLMVLLRLALNGWAMFFLVRRLLDGTHAGEVLTPHPNAAGLLAGVIYMLYPAVQGQLFGSHAGIIALWGAPLYIDALYRLREHHRLRDFVLAGLFFVAIILGSNLMLLFMALPITVYFALLRLLRWEWVWLRRVVIAGAIGMVFAAVFFVPAAYEQATSSSAVDPGGVVRFSADVLSVVTPSFFHPLFSSLEYPRTVLGTNIVEGMGYIGVIAAVLAVIGVWRVRFARHWLGLVAVAWVLSLGPILKFMNQPVTFTVDGRLSYVPMPFALLSYLPVLSTIRTPGRFNLVIGLLVAIMAGYGAAVLLRKTQRCHALCWGMTALLVMGVAFEYQLAWENGLPHFPTVPATIPDEIRALRDDENVRAVLNLPHDNLLVAKEAMYLQTGHQKPMVAGFISRQTPVSPAKLNLLQSTLDPALLNAADTDVVILFRQWDENLNTHVYEQLGTPFYENERIAAFYAPDSESPPEFTTQLPETEDITQSTEVYFYTRGRVWAKLTAVLTGENRKLVVLLDGDPIQEITIERSARAEIPVRLEAGYHTVRLALDPPCPDESPRENIVCRAVQLDDVQVSEPIEPTLQRSVQFEQGIILRSATINENEVWLWWVFMDEPTTDIVRFVHVVDESGEQVAGMDAVLNGVTTQHAEQITFENIPTGTHDVYTGWYTLPDVARLNVQTNVPSAESDWVYIGEMRVR